MNEDFPLTLQIIEATSAAKNGNASALQMCNNVAKQFTSTNVNGNNIWTLPQEQKYLDLSDENKLYYCKSGQFVEDVKYASLGNWDKIGNLLDSFKNAPEEIKKELNETLAKQAKASLNTLVVIGALTGIGIIAYLAFRNK